MILHIAITRRILVHLFKVGVIKAAHRREMGEVRIPGFAYELGLPDLHELWGVFEWLNCHNITIVKHIAMCTVLYQ